jgi:hypothetical protein
MRTKLRALRPDAMPWQDLPETSSRIEPLNQKETFNIQRSTLNIQAARNADTSELKVEC